MFPIHILFFPIFFIVDIDIVTLLPSPVSVDHVGLLRCQIDLPQWAVCRELAVCRNRSAVGTRRELGARG